MKDGTNGVEPATIASTSSIILEAFLPQVSVSFDFASSPSNVIPSNNPSFTTPESIQFQLQNATNEEREVSFFILNKSNY